jgi:hypothetical protein
MTCPVQGCDYPAGTACTMAGCPGTSLRPRSLTGVRKGDGAPPLPVPSPAFDLCLSHIHAHTEFLA